MTKGSYDLLEKIRAQAPGSLFWESDSEQISFAELSFRLVNSSSPDSSLEVIEARMESETAIAILRAWVQNKVVCLLPPQWPEAWKQSLQNILQTQWMMLSDDTRNEAFYLVPTSGSTGTPKWVLVGRESWSTFISNIETNFDWDSRDRVALSFLPQFDPFLAMLFLAVGKGATLVPLSEKYHLQIFDFCKSKKISVWAAVPSLCEMNLQRSSRETISSVRESIMTGEALTSGLCRQWEKIFPHSRIRNFYGPVETTVWVSEGLWDPESEDLQVSIGQIFPWIQYEIENDELVILGRQVAMGYMTEQGLMPFLGRYATGDRVHFERGSLSFLGRVDQQCKIRGQRVELGALESYSLEKFGIFSVALKNEQGELVLFTGEVALLSEMLRSLQKNFPAVYRPRKIYLVPRFPTNSNGKLDRQQLLLSTHEFSEYHHD